MPKLSVIVPVYNSERLLERCVKSVLNQSFKDFELLLVNDGSIDSSLSICQAFADSDARIKVIDKPNGGVSSARNAGLGLSCGKWVTFIDSDDWISKDYFEILNHDLKIDLIVGSIFFVKSQNIGQICVTDACVDYLELRTLIQEQYNNSLFNSPCAKFYRKDIIVRNKVYFDETLSFGEDSLFVKMYLLNIHNLQIYNKIMYYYDDIGDAIYGKYNKSFLPIYDYYRKMSCLYESLEHKYQVRLSKLDLIGVSYNLLVHCIKKDNLKEWDVIKLYLNDCEVRTVLKGRRSLHINIMLRFSKCNQRYLFDLYFRFVERLKQLLGRK